MHKETLQDKIRSRVDLVAEEQLDKNFFSIDHPRTKQA